MSCSEPLLDTNRMKDTEKQKIYFPGAVDTGKEKISQGIVQTLVLDKIAIVPELRAPASLFAYNFYD